jgi:hypothetical protein
MHLPAYLLLGLLVLLAIYGLGLAQVLRQLRRANVRPQITQYSGRDVIAPEHIAALEQPRAWLEAQGFQFVAWQQESELIGLPGQPLRDKPKAIYLDASQTVRCRVGLPAPRQGAAYSLSFSTTLRDGSEICTLNRAGVLPAPPDYRFADRFLASDALHLALHLQRIGGQPCVALSGYDGLLTRSNLLHERVFAHWLALGLIEAHSSGWRLSWSGAVAILRLARAINHRIKRAPPMVQS